MTARVQEGLNLDKGPLRALEAKPKTANYTASYGLEEIFQAQLNYS